MLLHSTILAPERFLVGHGPLRLAPPQRFYYVNQVLLGHLHLPAWKLLPRRSRRFRRLLIGRRPDTTCRRWQLNHRDAD